MASNLMESAVIMEQQASVESSLSRSATEPMEESDSLSESSNLLMLAMSNGMCSRLDSEWSYIFARLDSADGLSDGQISCQALLNWVRVLDEHQLLSSDPSEAVLCYEHLLQWVQKHDMQNFIDRRDFVRLLHTRTIRSYSQAEPRIKLVEHLRTTAYGAQYSYWPPPLFTLMTSLMQLIIFLYQSFYVEDKRLRFEANFDPSCSILILNPGHRGELWRLLTYSLVHCGLQHFLFNMGMQLFMGIPLELSHGSLRVSVVYLFGVIYGSLASAAIVPEVFLAGASAGLYALITSHLASLILNWHEDVLIIRRRVHKSKVATVRSGHIVRCIRLLFVLLYGIFDLFVALAPNENKRARPSYIAHLAGAAAGLMCGFVVLRTRKRERWKDISKKIALAALAACTLGLVTAFGVRSILLDIKELKDSGENHEYHRPHYCL